MWGCFLMSGVKILHFLKDWWKSIPIHQNYTMALIELFVEYDWRVYLEYYCYLKFGFNWDTHCFILHISYSDLKRFKEKHILHILNSLLLGLVPGLVIGVVGGVSVLSNMASDNESSRFFSSALRITLDGPKSNKHFYVRNLNIMPMYWSLILATSNSRIIVNRETRQKNKTLRWSYLLPAGQSIDRVT